MQLGASGPKARNQVGMHYTVVALEDKYHSLQDARRSSLGVKPERQVCRACYADYDTTGCLCGRDDWTDITIVVIEIGLLLDRLHRESKICTGEEECVHCLLAV